MYRCINILLLDSDIVHIFESLCKCFYHFSFMWQICGYIPQTIMPIQPDITQKAAQLSTSFFIETFIHAKEKVNTTDINVYADQNGFALSAYYGAVGGASHETIQRLPRGVHLVFGTYGKGHLVASAGITEMSQPDGSSDVPTALYSCDPKVEVGFVTVTEDLKLIWVLCVSELLSLVYIWSWMKILMRIVKLMMMIT